jgi:hypothetical protein
MLVNTVASQSARSWSRRLSLVPTGALALLLVLGAGGAVGRAMETEPIRCGRYFFVGPRCTCLGFAARTTAPGSAVLWEGWMSRGSMLAGRRVLGIGPFILFRLV